MKRLLSFSLWVGAITLLVIMTAPPVAADSILSYTGLGFTFANENTPPTYTGFSSNSPYTSSNRITITLDFADPLPPSLGLQIETIPVQPLSFTISDGIDTINNTNAIASHFEFATMPDGSISGWFIAAATSTLELSSAGGDDVGAQPCVDCVTVLNSPPQPSTNLTNFGGIQIAGTVGTNGQWSVPEPPSLFGILLAMALFVVIKLH